MQALSLPPGGGERSHHKWPEGTARCGPLMVLSASSAATLLWSTILSPLDLYNWAPYFYSCPHGIFPKVSSPWVPLKTKLEHVTAPISFSQQRPNLSSAKWAQVFRTTYFLSPLLAYVAWESRFTGCPLSENILHQIPAGLPPSSLETFIQIGIFPSWPPLWRHKHIPHAPSSLPWHLTTFNMLFWNVKQTIHWFLSKSPVLHTIFK